MLKRLYQYQFAREGLILQWNGGFGEIAPLPGFSKETFEEARTEVLHWMRTGVDPKLPSVRWGIECAKRPLQSVRLPLCALGPKKGFTTAKLKLGHLPLHDAIAFVKQQMGQFHLRLDCNRAWTLAQALEFASHFKRSDFLYLEEPVQTVEELIRFSAITDFPIALDESIHCDWSQIPSLRAIVVKPMIVGGIPEIPPHLDLVLSSSYESGLGLLHIANRVDNSLPVGLDTLFHDDLLLSPPSASSGFFSWNSSTPLLNMSKLCAL
jgi:O-succinylbenzoate synthase